MTIYPYFDPSSGCWLFDDEQAGLKAEPFVLGMSEMLTRLVTHLAIEQATRGFCLQFSAHPIPHDVELQWVRAENPRDPMAGHWYRGLVAGREMEGWLCPALYRYFETAPRRIFVKASPLPPDVDPFWKISPDDPRAYRYVEPKPPTSAT
jgi:hypothetical protein